MMLAVPFLLAADQRPRLNILECELSGRRLQRRVAADGNGDCISCAASPRTAIPVPLLNSALNRRRYPLPSPVWVPDARTSWASDLCGPASPWSLGGAVACPRRRRRRRPGQAPRSTVFLPSRRHRFPLAIPPVQRGIHRHRTGCFATRATLCIPALNRRRYPLHSLCMALYPSKRHGFPASVVRRRHGLSAPGCRARGLGPSLAAHRLCDASGHTFPSSSSRSGSRRRRRRLVSTRVLLDDHPRGQRQGATSPW